MNYTYFDLLQDTYSEGRWDYYDRPELRDLDIFKEQDCREFISKYLIFSGKEDILYTFIIDNLSSMRCQHMVYTFFLGAYCYEHCQSLRKDIDNEIERMSIPEVHIKSFYFIWFLICLCHDLYSNTEEDSQNQDIYEKIVKKEITLNDIDGVPKLYKYALVNYLKYRYKEKREYDHGIIGGYHFFSTLETISIEPNLLYLSDKPIPSKDLIPLYNYVAWIISCHNIWFNINECDIEKYKKYHLARLNNTDKIVKINHKKFPFFFLFCLVDTIEPYKKVQDIELLKNIDFAIDDDKIIINNRLTCGCKKAHYKAIEHMEYWLTKVNKNGNEWIVHLKDES